MKKYKVEFTYTESAVCVVEAESAEEAEFIMDQKLLVDGSISVSCDTTDIKIIVETPIRTANEAFVDVAYGSFEMEEDFKAKKNI